MEFTCVLPKVVRVIIPIFHLHLRDFFKNRTRHHLVVSLGFTDISGTEHTCLICPEASVGLGGGGGTQVEMLREQAGQGLREMKCEHACFPNQGQACSHPQPELPVEFPGVFCPLCSHLNCFYSHDKRTPNRNASEHMVSVAGVGSDVFLL